LRPSKRCCPARTEKQKVVLLSAQGEPFSQKVAREFSALDDLLLICGRYEGVDERVAEHLADRELSIGDFVLSGGELAAAVVIDAVARLLPGVLGNEESARNESFGEAYEGLLDCPQYTRPADFAAGKCPTYCSAVIMRKSSAGAGLRRARKRSGFDRI
jgi:tRNA (guanine37-N1)-methyltransferase